MSLPAIPRMELRPRKSTQSVLENDLPPTTTKRKAVNKPPGKAPGVKFRKVTTDQGEHKPVNGVPEIEVTKKRQTRTRKTKKTRKTKGKPEKQNSPSLTPSYVSSGPLVELSPSQSVFNFSLPAVAPTSNQNQMTDTSDMNEDSGTNTDSGMDVSCGESESSMYFSPAEDDEESAEIMTVEQSLVEPLTANSLARATDTPYTTTSQVGQVPHINLAQLSANSQSKAPTPRTPTPTQAMFLRNSSILSSFSETMAISSQDAGNQAVQTNTENKGRETRSFWAPDSTPSTRDDCNGVLQNITPRSILAAAPLSTLEVRSRSLRSEGSMREILPFSPSDFALNLVRNRTIEQIDKSVNLTRSAQETQSQSQSQLEPILPSPSALSPSSTNTQRDIVIASHQEPCIDSLVDSSSILQEAQSQLNQILPSPLALSPSPTVVPRDQQRSDTTVVAQQELLDNLLHPRQSVTTHAVNSSNTGHLDLLSQGVPSEYAQSHVQSSMVHPSSHNTTSLPMMVDHMASSNIVPVAVPLTHKVHQNPHSIKQRPYKGKQRQNVLLDEAEQEPHSLPSKAVPDYSPFFQFVTETLNTMCNLYDNGQKQAIGILEGLRVEQERLSSLTEGLHQRLHELPSQPCPGVDPSNRVPSPPPPPRRPRRKGVPSRPNVSDGDWHYFRESIRTHLKKLLKVEQLDRSLLKFKPLTEVEMEGYLDGNVAQITSHLALSAENFRLDMSQPITSIFNSEAQDIFIEDFLHAVQVRRWYSEQEIQPQLLTYEVVMNALATHLKHVWRIYKEESSTNPVQVKQVRQLRSARNTRKRSLYLARYEMVKHLIKQDPTLAQYDDLMRRIGTEGISSDESDHEHQPPVYRRVSPYWRSFELQHFLWRLDDLIFEASKNPIGTNRRFGPGQRSRQRVFGIKVNTNSVAPANLPRNCYNDAWLKGLRGWQRQKLNVQPVHDFSLGRPSGGTKAGPSGGTKAGPSGGTKAGPSGGTKAGPSGGTKAGPSKERG